MASTDRLNEPFRRRGEWWLPEAPDSRVAGDLEIAHHDAPRLELAHYLSDGHPENRYDVVLGVTLKGEPVTLQGARQIGTGSVSSRLLPEPITSEILSIDWGYVGAHLASPEDRAFSDATIELTDLLTWGGVSGWDQQLTRDLGGITVSLTLPDPMVVELPVGRLTLFQGWSTTGDLRSRGIERSIGFRVELAEPLDVQAIMARFGNPLRYLLTFATGRPNEIERLAVKTKVYDDITGTDVVVEYPRVGDIRNVPDSIGFDYLFDAQSLGGSFPAVVASWFELYDRVRPALNLLFGPRYRPATFTDNHFLNVVAAAEGYHRATCRNEVLPEDEHSVRLDAILAASPLEHRKWLEERLRYSNEPTLRQRLNELHDRAGGVVAGVLGSAAEYVGPVVEARNDLTHRGKAGKTSEISGRDMFRLTEETTFLLTACLMLDLGFDETAVVEATRRSPQFRLLTELIRRS
jgi:hypothetical protein